MLTYFNYYYPEYKTLDVEMLPYFAPIAIRQDAKSMKFLLLLMLNDDKVPFVKSTCACKTFALSVELIVFKLGLKKPSIFS